MKIALVGATGRVAGQAMNTLIEQGAEIVALVRHPEKIRESKVRVEQGDLHDSAFVVRATRGVDALLWLTPTTLAAPDFRAHTLGLAHNAVRAIRENSIQRVVFISSHGADRSGFGHVSFAGEVEKLLEAAAANTVMLRSAGHMENLLGSLESLKNGQLFGVLPPEKKYPLVAAQDVGGVAAKWLADSTWNGHHVRGVHGPEDLSAIDQVAILSRVLNRPIRYQQIPAEALRENFLKRGATPSVADAYFELFKSFAQTDYRPSELRSAETTTPTTLESFVRGSLLPKVTRDCPRIEAPSLYVTPSASKVPSRLEPELEPR